MFYSLIILVLATLPKMITAIGNKATGQLFSLLIWYLAGSVCITSDEHRIQSIVY
jgi:hypothetical protein